GYEFVSTACHVDVVTWYDSKITDQRSLIHCCRAIRLLTLPRSDAIPLSRSAGLITQARPDPSGALDPIMIQGDGFASAGDFSQWHCFGAVAPGGDHDTEDAFIDQIGTGGAEAGGEEAISGGGGAAALDVAEDRDSGFQVGEGFEMFGQAQGVAAVLGFQGV